MTKRKWVLNYAPKIAVTAVAGAIALMPTAIFADSEEPAPDQTASQEIVLESEPEVVKGVAPKEEVTIPDCEEEQSLEEAPEGDLSDSESEDLSEDENPKKEPETVPEAEEIVPDECTVITPVSTSNIDAAATFVRSKGKGRVDIRSFAIPESEGPNLAGKLSETYDDISLEIEGGIIVAVIINDGEDDSEEGVKSASITEPFYQEEIFEEPTEEVAAKIAPSRVIRSNEEGVVQDPLSFFGIILLIIRGVIRMIL